MAAPEFLGAPRPQNGPQNGPDNGQKKQPAVLLRIALVYVLGVVLSLTVATWVVVLSRPQLAGGPTFWPAFRELWEGPGSALLPVVLITGVLQAIVYRTLKARKAVWFVAVAVVLTSAMALGMEMLLKAAG